MNMVKMPVSVTADTSRIEAKLAALLKMLPEHVPDELLSMIASLADDIILADRSPAVSATGSFDIVYAIDFPIAAYSKVMAAARAFEGNITHQ